ncbi:hypothetical protein B566_EDAN005951 [Ephemera danica]|nr:hypothetical protein B566_EDAN005951 [Ephemera danica]
MKLRSSTNKSAVPKVREEWKKNLYENQGYPDNYTDTTFLYDLKKNINLRRLTFNDSFSGAGLLTREVCVVVLVVIVFLYLYEDLMDPINAFISCCICTAIGYLIYALGYKKRPIKLDLSLVVIYLTFGYFMSPILKTLTETISTDTIFVTSVLMMLIHLIFYDYDSTSTNVSRALSFNSALFASLCLASRLSTTFHVFVLLTVAVSCFALLPPLMLAIGRSNFVLFLFIAITIVCMAYVDMITTILYILCILGLQLLIPILVVKWQKYKENIYGPWDEANLTDSNLVTPRSPFKLK